MKVTMATITLTVKIPKTTIIRLWLFKKIMLFAVWAGGFNGVDFVEPPNPACNRPAASGSSDNDITSAAGG